MYTLFERINKDYSTFSKGQKRIADYIKEHYDKAAFMTAAKLGKKTQVSESTVVRFATQIGFEGYSELQKSLQDVVRRRLTSLQRLEVAGDRLDGKDVIENVLGSDINMIKSTMDLISHKDFNGSVEAIKSAGRIYILGVRSSAPLASFLAFYFNMVFENVTLVDKSGGSEIFESLYRINEDDVCIAISFPRYSKQTVNALRFVKNRGAKIVALTDNDLSPAAQFADYKLFARSDMASFVDSLVAPLSVINALIVGTTLERNDEISQNFNELEEIWEIYQVYQNGEGSE